MKELYVADIGYACFGVVVEDDIVKDAPPIARWLLGKNVEKLKNYVKQRNGKLVKNSLI
jgi:hypothetical protein